MSVGQDLRCDSSGCSVSGSVTGCSQARLQPSQVSAGGGSVSKLTLMVVGRIQSLCCWTEDLRSLLADNSCCQLNHAF